MHYHFVALDSEGKPFKYNNTTVRRHYTTTNCLEKVEYSHFLNLLRSNGFGADEKKDGAAED